MLIFPPTCGLGLILFLKRDSVSMWQVNWPQFRIKQINKGLVNRADSQVRDNNRCVAREIVKLLPVILQMMELVIFSLSKGQSCPWYSLESTLTSRHMLKTGTILYMLPRPRCHHVPALLHRLPHLKSDAIL